MNDEPKGPDESRFSREVGVREARKLKTRRQQLPSVWAGFGFFGLIGWSVVVPTLIGAAIGRWLDGAYPAERSWTLVFLVAGLVLGCLNAWRYVSKEHREIERESDGNDG